MGRSSAAGLVPRVFALAPAIEALLGSGTAVEARRAAEARLNEEITRLHARHAALSLALQAIVATEQERTRRFQTVMARLNNPWFGPGAEERKALIELLKLVETSRPDISIHINIE